MTTPNRALASKDELHTPEERKLILERMKALSKAFYAGAAQTGCHAMIEFTGFMNDFIKLCVRADEEGRDFTLTNVHSGRALADLAVGEARYLGEKFGCIFGTSFSGQEKLVKGFCEEAFGVRVQVLGRHVRGHDQADDGGA